MSHLSHLILGLKFDETKLDFRLLLCQPGMADYQNNSTVLRTSFWLLKLHSTPPCIARLPLPICQALRQTSGRFFGDNL